ncbi:MAG: radical SAM protein [Candidatus Beckwithbacteria bacterium]|nr:radical SAM protein [Candidatus Beckwithbacteria bacterium]
MLQVIKRKLAPVYEQFFSFWPNGWSPFPINVVFEILYGCNLNCTFCYLRQEEVVKKITRRKQLLTLEILKVIDQVPAQTALSFTGGEPLIHKDILTIVAYAKKKHRVGMISNLTAATKEQIKALISFDLDTLMFSLDGPTAAIHDQGRGKGSFKKTLHSLKLIQLEKQQQNKPTPTITMNSLILPQNYPLLDQTVKLAKDLKVDWLNFQLLDPSLDRSGYDLHPNLRHLKIDYCQKLLKLPKTKLAKSLQLAMITAEKLGVRLSFSPSLSLPEVVDYYSGKVDLSRLYCNKIFHLARISPFGDVYPCFNLKIGSVLDTPFMKLWNNSVYRRFRQQIKAGKFRTQCVGCCHLRLK